jgi:hypothetical protein
MFWLRDIGFGDNSINYGLGTGEMFNLLLFHIFN